MDRLKIVIMTCMWQRHELTDYIFARWKKEKEYCKDLDVILLAVGSEGDISKKIAERNDFVYVECENQPLNRKNNCGSLAAKVFNPDFLIYVNSDTLFSRGIISALISKAEEGFFYGLRDLYNLSIKHKKISYWAGWTKSSRRFHEAIGTGRCFNRKILETVDWQLWDQDVNINRGLDFNCTRKLFKYGFKIDAFYMKEFGIDAMEIKTVTNIWKWESIVHNKILTSFDMTRILSRLEATDLFQRIKYEQ